MKQSPFAPILTRLILSGVLLFCCLEIPAARSAQPASAGVAQKNWPLTRPEASDFAETSLYAEVVSFMQAMADRSPQIQLATFGYSYEGRPLPLAVIGAPGASPEQVLATKKTRVYMQGNIHAGEVEGKEALLWLLRSIAKGERAAWFKSVVLLIAPIYNPDGNDRVSVANRGTQNGPIGGMGQRTNAQGLDLNRDCTKMETAEARSLAILLNKYDPHVAIDLHTSDGSADSGYYLTYETSLNPNDSKATSGLLRGSLLPAVTKAVKAKHGWDYYYYGGVMRGAERAFGSDAELALPRFTSTYFGVRNLLGILVETYSYASFEDRIKASYWFLEEVIDYVAGNGGPVREAVDTARSESVIGRELAVRQQLVKGAEPVPIVFAQTVSERNPYVPDRPIRRRVPGGETTEMMPHYATTVPTETSLAPRAYVLPAVPAPVSAAPAGGQRAAASGGAPGAQAPAAQGQPSGAPPGGRAGGPPPGQAGPGFGGRGAAAGSPSARMLASVTDRLDAHGIKYIRTEKELTITCERFKIDSTTLAEREYQGTHKMRSLTGRWEPTEQKLPVGSIVVPMDQPLARLAFLLFDPRSDDGFMAWNILDPVLGSTPAPEYYPILRTMDFVTR
jgi:hypothetical protein